MSPSLLKYSFAGYGILSALWFVFSLVLASTLFDEKSADNFTRITSHVLSHFSLAAIQISVIHSLSIFDNDMPGCGSLCVYPTWSLSVWDTYMSGFHQIWEVVSYYFFEYFSAPFFYFWYSYWHT